MSGIFKFHYNDHIFLKLSYLMRQKHVHNTSRKKSGFILYERTFTVHQWWIDGLAKRGAMRKFWTLKPVSSIWPFGFLLSSMGLEFETFLTAICEVFCEQLFRGSQNRVARIFVYFASRLTAVHFTICYCALSHWHSIRGFFQEFFSTKKSQKVFLYQTQMRSNVS